VMSKSLKVSYNSSINSAVTSSIVYCHFTDTGNTMKSPDAGTQPAEGGGATVEHQGMYCILNNIVQTIVVVYLKVCIICI
jgi:hypothetical protein